MKTINKLSLVILMLSVYCATSQTTHYVTIGSSGFIPDSLSVDVNDVIQFSLNLNTADGTHYSETTTVPLGGVTWNYSFFCENCVNAVTINEPGTYLHYDTNSGSTGIIYTTTTIGIEEINKVRKNLDKRHFNILGQETNQKGFDIVIYDDGSVEKKYVIE